MIQRGRYYRNATSATGEDGSIVQPAGTTETEGKAWTWLDKFFGTADQAVDIYDRIRTPKPEDPYATDVSIGQQQKTNNTILIVGGIMAAALIGLAIYKTTKK